MRAESILALLFIVACRPPAAVEAQPEAPERSVELLHGPWEAQGQSLALATTGPRSMAGVATGPRILVAAWTESAQLLSATSFDNGWGWTQPAVVEEWIDLQVGTVRPELGLPAGGPVLAYAQGGVPRIKQRSGGDWLALPMPEEAAGSLFDLLVHQSEALLLWVQTGSESAELRLWDGTEETTLHQGPGLSTCTRPALGLGPEGLVALYQLRVEGGWQTMQRREVSGTWLTAEALGAPLPDVDCPGDAPVLRAGQAVVPGLKGEQRWLFVDGEPLELLSDHEALAPRGGPAELVWMARSPDRWQIMVSELALIGSMEPLVVGDPVHRDGIVLVPWDHRGKARAAVVGARAGD